MSQTKTPHWLRANLPLDPERRRSEYLRRYRKLYRERRPDYMRLYNKRYRLLYGSEKKNRMAA